MKKVLLVAAMLIIAAPVMATVSVTATDQGSGVVAFSYNCSAAEAVRAFALDITVDNGLVINGITDFNRGESKVPGGGYGIFPGSFANYINASSPNWADTNYTPIGRTSDPNTKSGLGTSAVTVELGSLYVGPNSPGASGLLFRLDVNTNSGAYDGNLSIALNGTRGGIVTEDGNLAPSPVLTGTKVTLSLPTYTISGHVTGSVAPKDTGISGLTIGGLPHSPIATDATGYYSDTVNQGFSGTVTVSDANGQWSFSLTNWSYTNVTSNQTQDVLGTALECLNKLDTAYSKWVTFNKPDCWCYQKNCRGDADGVKTLGKPVAGPDLTIFKAAYNQSSAYVQTLVVSGKPGICADFDRVSTLGKPVAGPDLTIFKTYYNLADTSVPVCPSTTINAWKN